MTGEQDCADAAAAPALLLWSRLIQGAAAIVIVLSLTLLLSPRLGDALGGKRWTERDDAIRNLARWLGYRRTGPTIEETGRSLINGLLREGRLESQGTQIRKV